MPATLPPDAVHTDRACFAAAVAAFLLYAAFFIYRTSFIVGGHRYFSLFDDAMVSMRYARNLAHGRGLVWNPGGERVEGYTNPLWVVFMAVVHRLPIAASRTSLVVQGSAAALLALNLYYVRRIALAVSDASRAVAWSALALTASYLPINNWSLQGMEVAALVPLISGCTWLAIRCLDTNTFQRRLYILLGIGTWIRPDIGVPFVAFLSFMVLVDRRHRRRHLAWGLGVLVVALASQTIFRLAYYGAALPNTFYLKMTGVSLSVRLARGAYVLLEFVWRANPLLFALTGVALLRRDPRIRLLFWILAGQLAYSVYVGGDAWEVLGRQQSLHLHRDARLFHPPLAGAPRSDTRTDRHRARSAAARARVERPCAEMGVRAGGRLCRRLHEQHPRRRRARRSAADPSDAERWTWRRESARCRTGAAPWSGDDARGDRRGGARGHGSVLLGPIQHRSAGEERQLPRAGDSHDTVRIDFPGFPARPHEDRLRVFNQTVAARRRRPVAQAHRRRRNVSGERLRAASSARRLYVLPPRIVTHCLGPAATRQVPAVTEP